MTLPSKSADLSYLPCAHLKGVGKAIADKLKNIGIETVQDLLFHLPLRYQDRTRILPIATIQPGDHSVIEADIVSASHPKGGRTRLLCQLRDATGTLYLRFFYVNKQQMTSLTPGNRIRCFGEVRRGTHGLEMIHPEYKMVGQDSLIPVENSLTPIYPATDGISQLMLRKLTQQALHLLTEGSVLPDILPDSLLKKLQFPDLASAIKYVHRPPPDVSLEILEEGQHISQKRLVFEELLAHRLSLLHLKESFQTHEAIPLPYSSGMTISFLKSLPFQLTSSQKRVADDIYQDLARPHPMLRLVQGDVGSGKTIVAALAILQAVSQGYQAVMMAPTELLAEQHARTFKKWFEPFSIQVVLLTGQLKTSERRAALEQIESGAAQIVLGTHAIFQKHVAFHKLALVVIDEQHRFGVEQRAQLREKGLHAAKYPHQLIMTATPIPRTLAMSVYADLDCSVIDELPPGRTPVTTRVIPNTRRDEVLEGIRHVCSAGRQVYWVCTLIEESDVLQCQAAENAASDLMAALPELTIALLHGRMKSAEKDRIMSAFKQGDIHLLVATTVIEVGVDVPNASLMVIENAERLGLAQLHQLRGRVGRGAVESHCLLMYQTPLSRLAKERLAVMRETTDGFKIAERDLKIRGPGEVLGTKQTGDISLRIADLVRDSEALPDVQQAANLLQKEHPDIIRLLIKRWLGNNERFGRV